MNLSIDFKDLKENETAEADIVIFFIFYSRLLMRYLILVNLIEMFNLCFHYLQLLKMCVLHFSVFLIIM